MSMSETQNSQNRPVSLGAKARYVGVGIVIGVVVAPLIRKAISKIQPKVNDLFDSLTGKTEEMAEKVSDLLAKAKENLAQKETSEHTADAETSSKPHVH